MMDWGAYKHFAYQYSRSIWVVWCISGWTYAAMRWHLLWRPALLVVMPGVIVSIVLGAALSVLPRWIIEQRLRSDREAGRQRNRGLVAFGIGIGIVTFAGQIAASIGYVILLQRFIE